MHGAIALHPAPYKGMLPLRSRRHVGVIAIGNALGNAVVAGLSDKPKAKTPAEEKKLSATEQADLDLKMAEMDAALHNRMEGKAEDGATYTPNGTEEVRTYTTTAKVDSSGNVYEQTNGYHINKKELQNLVYEDQGKALLSVLSLQHDDELSFGRDSILSREKGRFLSADLNDYIDQAHGRKALSDALANVSLTGITGTFRSAWRSFTRQAEEKVVPVAREILRNSALQKAPVLLNPNRIRFSQDSVTFLKRDRVDPKTGLPVEPYRYDDIVSSMRKQGWDGPPIDVVRMQDGLMTSVDNTRLLAAREAGIDVLAQIRSFDERLPEDMIEKARFTHPKTGEVAKTWGQAIEFRVARQPLIKKNQPLGTYNDIKLTYPKIIVTEK